jgi:hypothetical protein
MLYQEMSGNPVSLNSLVALPQAIIALLLIGLVLTIPVAVLVFLYNLKSGFRAVEIDEDEEGNGRKSGPML